MTINCLGELVDLTIPKVMGILNCTPNSFYDGGKFKSEKDILQQVEKMLNEGATFIDIGANSSKPNADFVSEEEERTRLLPVIELVIQNFPKALLSIDTFRSSIASAAIQNGAAMINDISAGKQDDQMFETIAKYNVPYVMMHMRGTPQTMQSQTQYDNVVKDILFYFAERIAKARTFGINDLIIDPGFGFAKNENQNYDVLHQLELFETLELPILVGISRKSMVYKPLNSTAIDALNGTAVLNTIALSKGAKILRVHDVKEAVECITLVNRLNYRA